MAGQGVVCDNLLGVDCYRSSRRAQSDLMREKVEKGSVQTFGGEVVRCSLLDFAGCKPWIVSPRACDRNIAPQWRAWHEGLAGYLGEIFSIAVLDDRS